jgi:hypothetical protein
MNMSTGSSRLLLICVNGIVGCEKSPAESSLNSDISEKLRNFGACVTMSIVKASAAI